MVYDIAGLRVQIENKYEYTTKFCREYLSEDQASPCDITASVTDEAFAEEKALSPNFSDGYIENICLYRSICQQMPLRGRMLLHASVLEYDGNGYAFLGKSGTGKSTHTRLWLTHLPNTRVVNGDKPILEDTKDGFIAYGTSWRGKEGWGCKAQVPLRGLCFLEQAKENSIRRLTPAEVTQRLFVQLLLPEEESAVVATLELADSLIKKTPAYLLRCDISDTAVKTSFEAMTGKRYESSKKRIKRQENSMKIKKGFVLREVGGETVVVPVGELSKTFHGMINLNETGAFLWRFYTAEHTIEEGVEALCGEYEVERETALADVEKFAEILTANGFTE